MSVTLISLWRNDEHRQLERRTEHLLSKVGVDRWLWLVGDSRDATEMLLRQASVANPSVDVVRCDTLLRGEDLHSRRQRLSMTFSLGIRHLDPGGLVCLHESDLKSAPDVVMQLMRSCLLPIAGWPVITLSGEEKFYDIWAYRRLDGTWFLQDEPKPKEPILVGGFGSVWLAPTELVRGRVITQAAIWELCQQWRSEGIDLWVDPAVRVEQPSDLWTPVLPANFGQRVAAR